MPSLKKGNLEKALGYYQQSLLYPDHLEVAEQPDTIHARKNYLIGKTLVAMGEKRKARAYFEAVIADQVDPVNAYQYFRGRAMEATGKTKEALGVYGDAAALGDTEPQGGQKPGDDRKEQSVWWYTRGLALEGLGNARRLNPASIVL